MQTNAKGEVKGERRKVFKQLYHYLPSTMENEIYPGYQWLEVPFST